MGERKFIFKDNVSNKFWNIKWDENTFTVTYGKIGSKGTTKTTSSDKVLADVEAVIKSKVKKGYVEESSESTSSVENEIKYTDALVWDGEEGFHVGDDISSKICTKSDEGNDAWRKHLIFHDAWHDCDINFRDKELNALAKEYGYTKEFMKTAWDDDDFEIDDEFSNECHAIMEEYTEVWRCANREVEELVTSRATSLMAMNAFDYNKNFDYKPKNKESITVMMRGNFYWAIIWELDRYTQIVGDINKDPSLLISEYIVGESKLEEIVKKAIETNTKLGYKQCDEFSARKLGYMHSDNVISGMIHSGNMINVEREELQIQLDIIEKCKDENFDKAILTTIKDIILNPSKVAILKNEFEESRLQLCEIYSVYGEDCDLPELSNPKFICNKELFAFYFSTKGFNLELAEKYMYNLAMLGSFKICLDLAFYFFKGKYFAQNYDKAAFYCDLLFTLASNDTELSGVMNFKKEIKFTKMLEEEQKYLNGLTVETATIEDLDKVVEIARCYYFGTKNFYKGYPMEFIDFAVKCNYPKANAFKGRLLIEGYNCTKDVTKGIDMLLTAYKTNPDDGFINFLMSSAYQKGEFGEVNAELAMKHIRKSAEVGYADAWGQLSYYHEIELEGPNPKGRFEAALKGAELNTVGGHINTAECYELGTGTEIDLEKAYYHAEIAAELSSNWKAYYLKLKKLLNK